MTSKEKKELEEKLHDEEDHSHDDLDPHKDDDEEGSSMHLNGESAQHE